MIRHCAPRDAARSNPASYESCTMLGMTTLRDIKARAKVLGAKVEDDKCGQTHECRVEAPYRKRWSCDGIHELIDSTNRPWKPDYADLLDRMNHGLEDCIGDCEWCDGE